MKNLFISIINNYYNKKLLKYFIFKKYIFKLNINNYIPIYPPILK